MPGHDIVVLGASAGGVDAFQEVAAGLSENLPAAVFMVLHLPDESPSVLAEVIDRAGPLPASSPEDREPIEHGRVYVAPSDHHMLVDRGQIRVAAGPHHNGRRPAIDPLFESASRAYGSGVIGVVLTGMLDDGAAGLRTIQRRGGLAMVQDPETALFDAMPRNALKLVSEVSVVPLDGIAEAVTRRIGMPARAEAPCDADLDRRFASYLGKRTDVNTAGAPSVFACPQCGGVLWQTGEGNDLRYECRIGHSFSPEGLVANHDESVVEAMAAALRALDENANLNRRMARQLRERNILGFADNAESRAVESEGHAQVLRDLLNRGAGGNSH